MKPAHISLYILTFLLSSCMENFIRPGAEAQPNLIPTQAFATSTIEQGSGNLALQDPEERILIMEPGPGSLLRSPISVSGFADSTFEQHLLARLLLDDGTEISSISTTIQSAMGLRGPFKFELSFEIIGERQAFLQVISTSPRDGGIEHLSTVGIRLTNAGEPLIQPKERQSEQIIIFEPIIGAQIKGGSAHIEGFALASFEQTLVAEVLDQEGNIIGSRPLMVDSPDWGIPGPFSVEVTYSLESGGAGRIVVRDPSQAFNGDIHLASVEVNLSP